MALIVRGQGSNSPWKLQIHAVAVTYHISFAFALEPAVEAPLGLKVKKIDRPWLFVKLSEEARAFVDMKIATYYFGVARLAD
jgi:hypothetical protein